MTKDQRVYRLLEELGIEYRETQHPPVYTVEEVERYWRDIPGAHCKNLFLRDPKERSITWLLCYTIKG